MAADPPTPGTHDAKTPRAAEYIMKLILCATYIFVSSLLIRFNKFMMHEDRFPFALGLSAIHMFVSTLLCSCGYLVAPWMFTAMEATRGSRRELFQMFLPIAALFAVMLYGSNQAYAYCNVALLQFMKEANVVLVFMLSCAAGLQYFDRMRVTLIVWIIASASISVSGDLRPSFIGIAFQAVGQIAECSRMVMGECVLKGRKLDPLTYTFFLAPLCFVVLLVAVLARWDSRIPHAMFNSWPLLLANATLAFMLNVIVAAVIKETSAVGFVLTGLTKDIFLVIVSWSFFGEAVTHTQWAAFCMTLIGVGLWSLMKAAPGSAPIGLLKRLLCVPEEEPLVEIATEAEKAPLITAKV